MLMAAGNFIGTGGFNGQNNSSKNLQTHIKVSMQNPQRISATSPSLNLGNSHNLPHISTLIQNNFHVTKVATFDGDIDWHIARIFHGLVTKDVVVLLHSSLYNEENFLSRIVLSIKCIIFIHFHLAE